MAPVDESRAEAPVPAVPTEKEDCLGCRVTGTITLLGLSTFFMFERSKMPRHDLGQRRWLLFCSGMFAVAGVWRATTGMFATEKPQQQDEKRGK